MKIEEQVLSIEQMKHLQELGVDTSDASMCWLRYDVGGVVKVSDGACHFEDSVVGSGREIIASHGSAEHVGGLFVQAGILFQQPASHLSVAVDAGAVLETLGLNLSCFFHTLTNHGT